MLAVFGLTVALFLFYSSLPILFEGGFAPETMPATVKACMVIEVIFGSLLMFMSLGLLIANRLQLNVDGMTYIAGAAVGLGWVCFALCLSKQSKKVQGTLLIASIVRFLTVVGIPFSIASVSLSYGSKASRAYYASD